MLRRDTKFCLNSAHRSKPAAEYQMHLNSCGKFAVIFCVFASRIATCDGLDGSGFECR
jgi:hypothetical protein